MIVFTHSNIDIIQGVIGYGNATEGITDWRITNTNSGIFNISNSSSIIRPSGGTSEIGEIPGSTDRYMIFTAGPSTFTVPSGGIKCDILVVGGGGGGGFDGSGGGGGGEVKYYTNNITTFKTGDSYTLTEGTYTVNVGTGGAAGVNINSVGTNGTISEIKNNLGTTLLSAGGGGGGGSKLTNGNSALGGGGGGGMGGSYIGGSSTGSGGIGGNPYSGGNTGGGGGGGANVANKNGGNGQSTGGGVGGVGVDINITGTSKGFGGGGAGGTWQPLTQVIGTYGGGNGGTERANPSIGMPNTGGGGGGGGNATYTSGSGGVGTGGNGGSGIVIIRYSTANISIIDNGNVGFGITPTTNSSLVEIAGDVNITGNYRVNNIDIINSTSNYVLSTSNLIVPRISTEVNNGSNYASSINTVLNTRINDTSNYIMTTNSIIANQYTSKWTSTSSGIYYNTPISETVTLPEMCMTFTYTSTSSGLTGQTEYTFTLTETLTCDILIVGGGGGGGKNGGGGGGGSGYVYFSNITLIPKSYTIRVGAGSPARTTINGYNSSFWANDNSISYTSLGGGIGGSRIFVSTTYPGPYTGGCGGGGGGWSSTITGQASIQSSTYGYGIGFNGGNGYDNSWGSSGGGGGGAGSNGLNASNYQGGNGGNGVANNITGTSIIYCAGGGGGRAGGGGANGNNGSDNTGSYGSGSCGGGEGDYGPVDAAANGVVIIKFRQSLPLTTQNDITSVPVITPTSGVTTGSIGIDRYIILTYTTDNTGTGQTQYNINVPTDNIICDILMVGGGGAGGKDIGGGGGGGAVLYGTNISIPKTNYILKVGRGATPGEVRGKSTEGFGTTVLGGGSASNTGWDPPNANGGGNSGGSGAGGKGVQAGYATPLGGRFGVSTKGPIMASSIFYNGNLGGNGLVQGASGTKVAGGGGGGAVSNGGDGNSTTGRGGDGGDGVEINIIGTSYWWGAGGGGDTEGINNTITGGNGGKGGGGAGGASLAGVIGQTINGNVGTNGYGIASGKNAGNGTGSGGGGARYQDMTGGNGGSGIIIIRYRNKPSIANVGIGTTTPATDLHIYDDTINNTTLTIQNNYIDPITITPNTGHTVLETIENNRYYRTLTFTYNVSYPVLADDANYLFAWYKLDGNLIDSSRFAAVATLPNGAITYTTDTSKFSNLPNYISATFNGTASATGAYALTPTIYKDVPLSFAFWFMTTGTAYYTMMGYGDKSTNSARIQFDFYLTSGTSYQLTVYTALNNQWTIQPTATGLSLNTWYFCVYTLSSTSPVNCVLYINGTQRATGSGNASQTLTANKDLTIGASGDGGRGFVGQLADIRIYNKVLSLAEITTLYTVNTPASIVSTINFRVPTTIFVNNTSGISVNGLYNISVGPSNSSVLKAQGQAVDPYPSTAITTISIKYEYKDATLSLPKLIDVPGTTTTTIGTTDRCVSFPYTTETIADSGQTEYIFSPTESIVCDILLVGGGGSGGCSGGSGGGGDVLEFNNINLDAGSYRILVGNGGVYVASNNYTGNVGKNTSITINNNTLIAAGGGGGGAYGYSPAVGWTSSAPSAIPTATFLHPITLVSVTSSGGGGGGANQSTAGATGTGISGNGGRNSDNNGVTGGGGGGAAPPPLGNGGNSTITGSSNTGNGGKGISSYITGTLIEYGGGGAGGRWNDTVTTPGTSSGGGGFLLRNNSGTVWTANFFPGENGRGGGGTMSTGGGSGIVIIRYRKVVSSASIELIRLSNNSVNEIVIAGTISTVIGSDRCIQFLYSGSGTTMDYTFTTTEALNCDILIVAGGGSGGQSAGGGGGAGGLIYVTNIYIDSGITTTVKVGKGGSAASYENGVNSSFGTTYVAVGGGVGATMSGTVAGNGGSGGGGNRNSITDASIPGQPGGSGTINQGNSGGTGKNFSGSNAGGGGGGGAGAPGSSAFTTGRGANGGIGLANSITGAITYYAGGGGGGSGSDFTVTGSGGLGGGGNGSIWANTGGNASANTGGGGGGGSAYPGDGRIGGNGGSGIVIMRYRKVANYKIGNFSGDFKIIATSTANNNTEYMRIAENGSSIYNATGSPLWSTVSDRRIKENIEKASYEKCYNNLERLELYRFNYISELNNINKDLKQLGYIAQEVNEIFPKSVSSQSLYNNTLSISDLLSIDITQINYTLFGSVKRLIELINNKILRLEKLENILNINNSGTSNLLIVEPITSNLLIEQITSNIVVEQITSNLIVEELTSNIVVEPITSNLLIEQITSNLIVEPITSNLLIEQITSNLIVEQITSNLIVEPITSNLIVEELTSNIVVEELTSNLIVEELTSN